MFVQKSVGFICTQATSAVVENLQLCGLGGSRSQAKGVVNFTTTLQAKHMTQCSECSSAIAAMGDGR